MNNDLSVLSSKSYKELLEIYSKNFSLGFMKTDIKNKFALISLICYITYKAKEKKPDITHYSILQNITKDYLMPDAYIKALAVICDDFAYGCTEFPTFEIPSKKIISTIKDLLREYVPF